MLNLQNELTSLWQRSNDRQLRLAITGLSRSGKTAFITALVNQLLNLDNGARLPLFSAARQQRLLGVRRVPQRDLSVPRFNYQSNIEQLLSSPPEWPSSTRGVSQVRLQIKFRSQSSILRHLKALTVLDLEIVDYPGEWLLDLPMLEQDYQQWSQQMISRLKGDLAQWAAPWLKACQALDPLAPADENQLAELAQGWTQWLIRCQQEGLSFIQPGRFVLPGDLAGAPILQFFPWPLTLTAQQANQAARGSTYAVLKQRYDHYCQHIIKPFYQHYFKKFDRQVVLVDCLQALNQGPEAFNDMRDALGQLMQSFNYGKRTLARRLFAPVIDKLLFAATKADHLTPDQHSNLVSLLEQLVREARQHASYAGINIDCQAIAAIEATESGTIRQPRGDVAAIRGVRLKDDKPLILYPGEVPRRLPKPEFWQQQGFQFEQFRPKVMEADRPMPHIRLDSVLEFLLGDKVK